MWKDIVSVDSHYEISVTGMVRDKITRKIHKIFLRQTYPSVTLKKNGKSRQFLLHRLLLLTFIGCPKKGEECRHLDGNPLNYNLSNLKWGTHTENMCDIKRHGKGNGGSANGMSKLTDEKVLAIDCLVSNGFSLEKISRIFCVSVKAIWSIKQRKTWKHLFPGK